MTLTRGDVVLARIPHMAGTCGEKRPAVIILDECLKAALAIP
jgi:hypothetical protein